MGYRAFYRGHWAEGKLAPCNDPALKSQARRLLASGAASGPARPTLDVASIAASCLTMEGERQPAGLVLRKLGKAFEFLELLCVNLFLLPWRKEIKSLKVTQGERGGSGGQAPTWVPHQKRCSGFGCRSHDISFTHTPLKRQVNRRQKVWSSS